MDRKLAIKSVITDLFAIFVVTLIRNERRKKQIRISGCDNGRGCAGAVFPESMLGNGSYSA